MSGRYKRKFGLATFMIVPMLLLVAALVPAYLSVTTAEATNASDWTKVKGYVAGYIAYQYDPAQEGEAGYLISPASLNTRINSVNDTAILGEGDDAATAPVLVDNLGGQPSWIPGTSERCAWNANSVNRGGTLGTDTGATSGYTQNCFDADVVNKIKAKVDAHAAAGFSTDIVDYCVSGKTEAPTTGSWGFLAQAGALRSDGSKVRVYGLEYGRNGWNNTSTITYDRTGAIGAATPAATYTPPTVNDASTACNSSVSDAELVRCQVQQSIYNLNNPALTIAGMVPGNVSSGQAPGGTAPAATLNTGVVIDTRTGTPGNTISTYTTYQLPIDTLFTTGLANIPNPAPGTGILIGARTPMVGGIVAQGMKVLGFTMAPGGFINDGLKSYNNSLSGGWVSDSGGRVALTSVAIDSAAPVVSGISAGTITESSAVITRTTSNEPATMKVEYGTSPGVYAGTVNNTILNQSNKTVSLTGLNSYTTYYYRVTSYDGQANGAVSSEASFRTLDSTGPTVSNVYPADGAILNNITSLTITADYSDTGSGVDTASVMVHLDVSNMLMSCLVQTASHVECNAAAGDLDLGTHPLDIYVTDMAGNETINRTYFTVADAASPAVTYTGPSGNINDNTPTVTGTYSDPAPSSGIASATLSLDGGGSFPYTCVAASGAVTCDVTPAVADGARSAIIRLTDVAGNIGTASGSFTVDTSLPGISSVLPSGWITTTSPATVQAALSDTGSGINTAAGSIAVDVTPLGSCTVTTTSISCDTSAANFAQGAHTILVTAFDLAGNTQTGGGSFSVDSAAPAISNIQPSGAIGTSSTTITADYSDLTSGIDQATVSVTLDTVAMTGCTVGAGSVSCPATGLADGAHAIAVTVDDVAGNTGSGNGSFSVDTAAPTVTPDSLGFQPGNWTADTTPTVSATISGVPGGQNINAGTVIFDKGTGNEYSCSGGEFALSNTVVSCTPGTARAAGSHTVEFTAEYSLNHPGSGTTSINIDTAAPSTTNIMPSGNITVNSTTISGDYSDGGSGIDSTTAMVHVDGSMIMSGCTATGAGISCPKSGLAEGVHNIEIIVKDNVGNTQTGLGSFTVDTIAPSVTNLSPGSLVASASPTVSGDYSDGGTGIDSATAQITVDGGGALAGCTATGTGISCPTSSLADGLHNYTVSVNDAAGNPGSSSGSFTVDTTAPSATSILPGGIISSSSTTVTADLSDANGVNAASVIVNLDGSPMAGCTITATTASCPATGLAEGAHTIAIALNDNATNPGAGNGSFTVDTLAPGVTNLSPSGDITTSSPTITADFADTGGTGIDAATAVVTLDGNPVAGCSATTSGVSCTAAVTSGAHNYSVSVDDLAGNTGSSSGSFTLTQLNYYFPWYDNMAVNNMKGDWLMISNLGGVAAEVKIYVGDISDAATPVAQYDVAGGNAIAPNGQVSWYSQTPLADGPVRVVSTNGQTLLVSQRVLYKDSFNEIMAASDADIDDTEFDFTWYDNDPAHSMGGNWIMVGNIDTAASATADVYIGGVPMTTLTVPAGEYQFWQAPTLPAPITDGPVQVISRSGQKLVVSQRVIYRNSFNEVLASEKSSLQDEGFFTWYDSDPAHGMGGDWVMASNMGSITTDVEIYLNNVGASATPVATITGVLPGEAAVWISDTVRTEGPVRVRSTNGQPLMTSQRVVYKSSFEEVQGLTPAQMGTNADFNWYDWQSAGMNGDWILIGNQNASGKDMGITIASTPMVNVGTGTANFPVSANATVTPSFAGLMNGPVRATCSSCAGGDKLIISQRVIYKDSFNEVVGRARS